jgi:Big-like domain-containing protein
MKLLRTIVSSLAPLGVLVLQISCGGGDASGPGTVATKIVAHSATAVTAPPGTQVTQLPSVLVSDASGNPVAGAPVTFTVTSGGGTVTGGTETTNSSGIATVGSWTLGTGTGANTLAAATGSLPEVTFTACGTATHTLGSTLDSQLSLTDCQFSDGSFVDFYTVDIPTSGTYIFNQTSTAFNTYLELVAASGTLIAVNDNFINSDSRLKVIVPAGTYLVVANSFDANAFGNYSLASAASTAQVSNCEDVFLLPGISTPQSLQTTDCVSNGFYYDEYVIFLKAGQTVTVSMTSGIVDSYLELRADGASSFLVNNDNVDATTKDARVTYTVPVLSTPTSGFYIITAASKVAGATGDYTLSIQ